VPSLTLDALRKQASAKKLERLYLFVGEDVRRIEEAVALIEATIDPGDQPFAIDRAYAGEAGASPLQIVDSARVLPMLGDRRIVIVLRAEKFLKPKRAAKKTDGDAAEAPVGSDEPESAIDLAPLEEYVKAPVPSATVVFVASDIDRTRRVTKALFEKAHVLTFGGLDGSNYAERSEARRAAERQVKEDFERLGRAIDARAARALVERAGGDISKLRDDTERLALYTEGQTAISLADVNEVSAIATEVDDEFAVVNAIADGDPARALRELGRRLDRGDSVFPLLGQIRWWVSAKLSQTAPGRVKPAIDAVLRTDLALKSSGGDERVLVERLVVELAGRQ
jgi:DNA polymerase III delta subunit